MTTTYNPYRSPGHAAHPTSHARGGELSLMQTLFSFQGRIPRSTYWGWSLALMAAGAVCMMIALSVGPPLSNGVLLATFPAAWIQLALQVKRWQDLDKSGWWILVSTIPIVGRLYAFFALGFTRGTEGPNRFGPDPTPG